MVRSILGFSVFAVIGVVALKLFFGFFGWILSALFTVRRRFSAFCSFEMRVKRKA